MSILSTNDFINFLKARRFTIDKSDSNSTIVSRVSQKDRSETLQLVFTNNLSHLSIEYYEELFDNIQIYASDVSSTVESTLNEINLYRKTKTILDFLKYNNFNQSNNTYYIFLEGANGTGKSTLILNLKSALGARCKLHKFPSIDPIINSRKLSKLNLLLFKLFPTSFYLLDFYQTVKKIKSEDVKGTVHLFDRSFISTIVHQNCINDENITMYNDHSVKQNIIQKIKTHLIITVACWIFFRSNIRLNKSLFVHLSCSPNELMHRTTSRNELKDRKRHKNKSKPDILVYIKNQLSKYNIAFTFFDNYLKRSNLVDKIEIIQPKD
jgi:shikimate kinase